MDIGKMIRMAVDSGKVEFGVRSATKVAGNGKAKIIVLASNCPRKYHDEIINRCTLSSLPFYVHNVSSVELGSICGKPFPVSALAVIEEGDSRIMNIVQEKQQG